MKTGIVVASRTEAKFFEYSRSGRRVVQYLSKLENPRGRLRAKEINSDKPGDLYNEFTYHGTSLVKDESPTESAWRRSLQRKLLTTSTFSMISKNVIDKKFKGGQLP